MYKVGLIKTVLINLRGEAPIDGQHDTYETMAQSARRQRKKTPFIGVRFNVGSKSHYSNKKTVTRKQQYSFGCPRIFFRFSSTSALDQVPFAFVGWTYFTAAEFPRTTVKGQLTHT
jgi:hypothetical protein